MSQQLVPENLLLHYIVAVLNGRQYPSVKLGKRQKLPAQLEVSEQFLEQYQKLLQAIVPQRLTALFRRRQFFLQRDEVAYQCGITDAFFWQNLEFQFSAKILPVLWQKCLESQGQGRAPEQQSWQQVADWDALWLVLMNQQWHTHYGYEWLLQKQTHWAVLIYFLLMRQPQKYTEALPWRIFFDNRDVISYPVRFVLLELAAAYYQAAAEAIEQYIDQFEQRESWRYYYCDDDVEAYDPRHPQFFNWLAKMEEIYAFTAVTDAYQYWCGQGAIGYDDDDHLRSVEIKSQLFHNIARLRRIHKNFSHLPRESQ